MSQSLMSGLQRPISRRAFLSVSAGLSGAAWLSGCLRQPAPPIRVAIVKVPRYFPGIRDLLFPYFRRFEIPLKGKRVLLKPNLVDAHGPDEPVFTHPAILAAAIELFGELGAKVVVAEGPGLRRDLNTVLHHSGYADMLAKYAVPFVDLNLDSVRKVRIPFDHTGLGYLFVPKTVLEADFIVSLPKLKTHHWVGVTLSLKNMLGIMPGPIYGWPKNKFHVMGLEESILDVYQAVRPHFAIIDGVVGVEGNGPLFGEPRPAGVVIMSSEPLAADIVAARIMGINPDKVGYLRSASREAGRRLSPLRGSRRIEIIGSSISSVKQNFRLVEKFSYLRS
jgi:uncharacterized protein (DUF362 family)